MPIRVLVIEDSLTVRKRLVEVLAADPELEVVGEASDGASGIAAIERLRPDAVTLDIVLPDMSGVAVTEHVMAHRPTPILIVSAAENRGEVYDAYQALASGAVDLLEKPTGQDMAAWERTLLSRLKLVSRIRVLPHIKGRRTARLAAPNGAPAPTRAATPSPIGPASPLDRGCCQLVGIGASTGGPAAIQAVLQGLPADFSLPILFVLHINEPFASSLVSWLDQHAPLPVRLAKDGEPVPPPGRGLVLMAPADVHLVVQQGRLRLLHTAERHSCRPSVDVLFESLARELGAGAIGCLLTGMGRDGAEGLLAMRRAGSHTIAQDEASSVVYGMPREAAMLGAAEWVLPLKEVPRTLTRLASAAAKGPGRTP